LKRTLGEEGKERKGKKRKILEQEEQERKYSIGILR
jgi:hypothetical protein